MNIHLKKKNKYGERTKKKKEKKENLFFFSLFKKKKKKTIMKSTSYSDVRIFSFGNRNRLITYRTNWYLHTIFTWRIGTIVIIWFKMILAINFLTMLTLCG